MKKLILRIEEHKDDVLFKLINPGSSNETNQVLRTTSIYRLENYYVLNFCDYRPPIIDVEHNFERAKRRFIRRF